MPTIFILFGFTFKYYSNEHEPIHVHIFKGGAMAKYSIDPVMLLENNGLKAQDLRLIESIIEENKELIAEHWINYFNTTNKK